jgi:5-methylcytosine-specific restriction endonuclease McrA
MERPENFDDPRFQWQFNFSLHNEANCDANAFLKRLSHIRAVRCRQTFRLSWFITSDAEWAAWDVAHAIATKGNFRGIKYVTDHAYVVGIYLPKRLLEYLRNRKLEIVKSDIVGALGWLYHLDELYDREEAFPAIASEVSPLLFDTPGIHDWIKNGVGYKGRSKDVMETQVWLPLQSQFRGTIPDNYATPEIVKLFHSTKEEMKSLGEEFESRIPYNVTFYLGYFKKDDWKRIVAEERDDDPLLRADTYAGPWETYKYKLFQEKTLRPGRPTSRIGAKRRFEILRRDDWTCQICGTTASAGAELEIDHKFPKSLGGSDEPDNLWTLCSLCNRGKGASEL